MRWIISLLLALWAAPAGACALALAFALDISVSVDRAEYGLQRDGLAAALLDPEVSQALLAQPGGVALMAYEWSGARQQQIAVPWSTIASAGDLAAFAATLRRQSWRTPEYPTALGRAIGFGLSELSAMRGCARLVLDVSGDGINNDGFAPHLTYKHFPTEGVTVNGLVIEEGDAGVHRYYLDQVIWGPAAFVERANGFQDYGRAMRRKLLREIQGPVFAAK